MARPAQELKDEEAAVQKEATSKFLLAEINRIINELDTIFIADNNTATNEEIQLRENSLSVNLLEANKLSDKFLKLLETIPGSYPNKAIVLHNLNISYPAIMAKKDLYKTSLLAEVKRRELEKHKSLSIEIKLEKFEGFGSELVIYSFKAEFELGHL